MAVNFPSMGRGQTTRVAVALVVLLVLPALDATAFSSARSSVSTRKGLLDSAETPRTIALDLMHAHHVESPYMEGRPILTMAERLQLSVANGKRRLQSAHIFTSPLKVAYAQYIVQITMGTPARTFVAIADTGSDLVWLECTNSTCVGSNCLQSPDLPFDPSASSSYSPLPCNATACEDLAKEGTCLSNNFCAFEYDYGDGSSVSGDMAYETVTFTSPNGSTTVVPGIAFGCATDANTQYFNGTDGFVGLGQGPLSLPSQLVAQSIINNAFSYCLVDYSAATTQTSPLLLGSTGSTPKSYTPLLTNNISALYSGFYYVNLVGITVNDEPISYPPGTFVINSTTGQGGIIVDSGTTITRLFDAALNPLESAISGLVTYPTVDEDSSGLDLCYNVTNLSSPVFPTVIFQFENANVTLGLNNTFILTSNTTETTIYCFAFLSTGTGVTNSIFGNVQQSHFEVSFDIENRQIGFGAGAC